MEKLKLLAPPKYILRIDIPKLLSAFAAGLLLSGTHILSVHLPAAVCLTAALGSTLPGALAYIGALTGGLLLWDPAEVLLTLAAGFLTLVSAWALQEMPVSKKNWFPLLSATAPGLMVGLMLLFSSPITPKSIVAFALQTLSLPLGVWACKCVLAKPTGAPICAAVFALVSGSGSILLPGQLPLGGILAGGAVFSLAGTTLALPAAALSGLALDWSWQGASSCAAVMTAAALAASYFPAKKRWLRLIPYLAAAGTVLIISGGKGGELFAALVLGGGLSLLFPQFPVEEPALSPVDAARRRLRLAARAMEEVYQLLEDVPLPERKSEISDVYDRATGKICATCAKFSSCWKQNQAETKQMFWGASSNIFDRGYAEKSDFPDEFRTSCRHYPELISAISEAVEHAMQLRQRQNYRREIRAVLGAQYRTISDFLRHNVVPFRYEKEPYFTVDAACLAKGKKGQAVSGDRCDSFRVGQRQYLLLCDGMGTGPEAADASRRAIQLLTSLLKSGMEPDGALETLGALSILRDEGGFSTVDLAWVSLTTGDGMLYKWGGGPSYIKNGKEVKKIGTATLPPGLGVGGTQVAQQCRLSLGRGEVLILTSDGVDGEDATRLIRAANGLQAKDLAAGLLDAGISEGEDDRSAAVLMLHPVSAR